MWPDYLTEAYPLAPSTLRKFPWWSRGIDHNGNPYVVRAADQRKIEWVPGILCGPDTPSDKEVWAGLYTRILEVEAKHPLPHPGYRVGQVWATALVDQAGKQRLKTLEEFLVCQILGVYRECTGYDTKNLPVFRYRMTYTSNSSFSLGASNTFHEVVLSTLDGSVPFAPDGICLVRYLLADPCCPHLAPWCATSPEQLS